MNKLFRATSIVGIATFVSLIAGFIRAKFTAVTLGPGGVGIFSQATIFLQFFTVFASLWFYTGLTKYIAEFNAEKKETEIKAIVNVALMLQLIASIIFIFIISIFSRKISQYLFSSPAYGKWLFLIALFGPFGIFAMTIESAMFGLGKYKIFTASRVSYSLLGLIPLVGFIYYMKLKGSFFYLAANSLILFLITYLFIFKDIKKGVKFIKLGFKKLLNIVKKLTGYSSVIFLASVFSYFVILFVRSLVIKNLGPEANGFYQVVFALSSYYLPFLTNALWSYFYPRISYMKEKSEFDLEINTTMRFCILCITPATMAIMILKNLIILIIFSKKFMPASALFSTQLLGDFFFILSYILGTSLLARAKLRQYLIINLGYGAAFMFLYLLFQKHINIKAVTLSYMISHATFFFINLIYHIKSMELTLRLENIKLLLISSVLLVISFFMPDIGYWAVPLKLGLIFVWFFIVVTKTEREKALALVLNKFKLQK